VLAARVFDAERSFAAAQDDRGTPALIINEQPVKNGVVDYCAQRTPVAKDRSTRDEGTSNLRRKMRRTNIDVVANESVQRVWEQWTFGSSTQTT